MKTSPNGQPGVKGPKLIWPNHNRAWFTKMWHGKLKLDLVSDEFLIFKPNAISLQKGQKKIINKLGLSWIKLRSNGDLTSLQFIFVNVFFFNLSGKTHKQTKKHEKSKIYLTTIIFKRSVCLLVHDFKVPDWLGNVYTVQPGWLRENCTVYSTCVLTAQPVGTTQSGIERVYLHERWCCNCGYSAVSNKAGILAWALTLQSVPADKDW